VLNQPSAARGAAKKLPRAQISAAMSATWTAGRTFDTTVSGGSARWTSAGVASTRTGRPVTGQADSTTPDRPMMTGMFSAWLAHVAYSTVVPVVNVCGACW
jgi:hypothetical protein